MSRAATVTLALLLAPGIALGQIPSDDPIEPPPADPATGARVVGSVYDRHLEAVADAQVELSSPDGVSKATTTDGRGRFQLGALAAGHWEISISAEGFLSSEGFVLLRPGGLENLRVEMRGLDERTPGFAEANPEGTVLRWLETGNELLEQGQATLARAEYEKALPHLDPSRRAEVLRAVARTFYVEQLPEAAAQTLWQALLLDPGSSESRQLYLGVMTHLGRDRQAEQQLDVLDADPPAEPVPEQRSRRARRTPPPLPELKETKAHRVGTFGVSFERRNEAGLITEVSRRYGLEDEWVAMARDYDPIGERYSVHVPLGYEADSGWGLLVWVSPTAQGGVRRDENHALLKDHRLIWIGADHAGNPRALWERIGLALDAAQQMQHYYDLDPNRIYVGGYSGGGRLAAALALLWPDVFHGGIAWFGTSWWAPVPVPYSPGHSWPPHFERPRRKLLNRLRKEGRIALVTGDLDFNRSETRAIHRLMEEEGIEGAEYFQIPDADHYFGVDAKWLGKAVDHLDQP